MADAVKQSLLLPNDMVDLRSMRQHEVFLGLKRDLAMVSKNFFNKSSFFFFNCSPLLFQAIQAIFRTEEMVNYSHQKMKEEKGRRIAVVDAFHEAEKSVQNLKIKLIEEEKERKSATMALDSAKKQAEGQRVMLRNAEDQLATS